MNSDKYSPSKVALADFSLTDSSESGDDVAPPDEEAAEGCSHRLSAATNLVFSIALPSLELTEPQFPSENPPLPRAD
ncbi:MAG TPA: hypothetical protein VMS18_13340 [Candidatus Binatia bacterium]|nr:hypothetical protein [Candidatus Binatia bacterium]